MANDDADFGALIHLEGSGVSQSFRSTNVWIRSVWKIKNTTNRLKNTTNRVKGRRRQAAARRHRLTGPVFYPSAWPRQMSADIAAAYCGEVAVEDFLKLVGIHYPPPRRAEGRRKFWLKDDLDKALMAISRQEDAADDF